MRKGGGGLLVGFCSPAMEWGSFFSVAKHSPWDYVGDLVENEKEDREQIFVC